MKVSCLPLGTWLLSFALSPFPLLARQDANQTQEAPQPSAEAVCPRLFEECVAAKKLDFERRGAMGFTLNPVVKEGTEVSAEPELAGARVIRVVEDTPAHRAGIEVGDVIVAWDGVDLSNETAPLFTESLNRPVGASCVYTILRDDAEREVTLVAEKAKPETVKMKLKMFIWRTYGRKVWDEYVAENPDAEPEMPQDQAKE